MRKNRTAKFIFNGALLAVMAVLGVTAYQVANKPEHIQEVLPLEAPRKMTLPKQMEPTQLMIRPLQKQVLTW